MTIPTNPYVAGNPVGGTEKFIGRQDVLSDVLQILANPTQNAIVLYGQRRIGKTSILKQLVHDLPREGAYIPVYFNLEDKAALPLEELLTELAQAIAQAIVPTAADATHLEELASAGVTKENFQNRFLPQALAALYHNASLVLLFDEFDELDYRQVGQAVEMFFPYLRQLMSQNKEQLQFIFVIGRQFEDLTAQTMGILKEAELKAIALLTRDDTARLVRLSAQNNSLVWIDSAIDRIWELTHGHPYLTQQLCSIVWENFDQERSGDSNINQVPTAEPEMVDAAIRTLFKRSAGSLQWIWKGLPPGARLVASLLAELAEARPNVVSQEELESKLADYEVEGHNFQPVYDTLQKWGLIEQVNDGYRFRVELLRRWLVQNKPSAEVKEEMAEIEPKANTHYRMGQQALQSGELAKAAREFARAVHINPNHIKARQELEKVLLKQQAMEGSPNLVASHETSPATDGSLVFKSAYKWTLPIILLLLLVLAGSFISNFSRIAIPESSATSVPESETVVPESSATSVAEITPTQEATLFSGVLITEETSEKMEMLPLLSKHTGRVWSVDFSPDGLLLASGGHDHAINLWYVPTGELFNTFSGHTKRVWSVDFSPETRFLASASEDGTIRLWDVERGEEVKRFEGQTGHIRSLAFTPDGRYLASGADDSTVRLWNVATGETLPTFEEGTNLVWSVAFSPDGTRLAAGNADKSIYVWMSPVMNQHKS